MYNVSLVKVLEKKLVYSVWVCWKAVITENTLKEKSNPKNNFYDNYNLVEMTPLQKFSNFNSYPSKEFVLKIRCRDGGFHPFSLGSFI